MSGYSGRRGVNVSQYVANLNTIPSQQDLLDTPPNFEEDLALFTNNDFVDWDAGVEGSFALNFDVDQRTNTANTNTATAGEPKMDFGLNGNFEFADFTGFNNPIVEQPLPGLPQSHTNSYPVAPTFPSPGNAAISPVSPVTPGFDQPHGKKRKLDTVEPSSEQSIDESARVAAEEDKRRRNTAASARFRIKKKQREQALEKTAKEMTERVNLLEARIQQLETENTWLKGLITEKNGGSKSASDISAMLKKRNEENDLERSTAMRTDGVGTKAEGTKA